MNDMRVAVCLYGKLDNDNIFNVIHDTISNKYEIDFFIHSWELYDNINDIINTYKPKKYIIDDENKYRDRWSIINNMVIKNHQICTILDDIPDVFSAMCVGELKRSYEIEENIEYDICLNINSAFKLSKDDILSLFTKNVTKNTAYSKHFTNLGTFPFEMFDYSLFMSDSETFDILSAFYKFLPIIKYDMFDENVNVSKIFTYYLRMFRINIK